jgi:hypothetical protein
MLISPDIKIPLLPYFVKEILKASVIAGLGTPVRGEVLFFLRHRAFYCLPKGVIPATRRSPSAAGIT